MKKGWFESCIREEDDRQTNKQKLGRYMETALYSSILPQRRSTGSSEELNLPELGRKKFDRRRILQNRFYRRGILQDRFWRGIIQDRIYRRSILQDRFYRRE